MVRSERVFYYKMKIKHPIFFLSMRRLTTSALSLIAATLVFSLLSFNTAFAVSDADYLDAIGPDETDMEVTTAKTVAQVRGNLDSNTLPDDLKPEQFEEALRSRYTGSFMFYSKLDDAKKASVYEEYLSNKDIEVIRKKIISLFSSR